MTTALQDTGTTSPGHPHGVDSILFEQRRRRLVRVGARILHSVDDSEDAVQDAWLRWHRSQRSDLANPDAFLTAIVTRLSLDQLRRVRARGEAPLQDHHIAATEHGDPQVAVELNDSVSEALFLLLQRLSPAERRAIVLRDVLDMPYSEVAGHVGRAEPAVRQLVSRGRRRLEDPEQRFVVDEVTHTRVVRCFLAVCNGGDLSALLLALAPSATAPGRREIVPLRREPVGARGGGIPHAGGEPLLS